MLNGISGSFVAFLPPGSVPPPGSVLLGGVAPVAIPAQRTQVGSVVGSPIGYRYAVVDVGRGSSTLLTVGGFPEYAFSDLLPGGPVASLRDRVDPGP